MVVKRGRANGGADKDSAIDAGEASGEFRVEGERGVAEGQAQGYQYHSAIEHLLK